MSSARQSKGFAEAEKRVADVFADTIGWRVDLACIQAVGSFDVQPGDDRKLKRAVSSEVVCHDDDSDLPAPQPSQSYDHHPVFGIIEPERRAALKEVARLLLGIIAVKFQAFLGLSEEAVVEVHRLLMEFDVAKRAETVGQIFVPDHVRHSTSGDFKSEHLRLAKQRSEQNIVLADGSHSPNTPPRTRLRRQNSIAAPDPPPRNAEFDSEGEDSPSTARKDDSPEPVARSLDKRVPRSLRMGASARVGLLTSTRHKPKMMEKASDAAAGEGFTVHPVPQTESFMVDMVAQPHMKVLALPDVFLNLYYCIRTANIIVLGLRTDSPDFLNDAVSFIKQPVQRGTYCSGDIRQKEPHTFLFTGGSCGAMQVGIPPETIKTSMRAGEEVPQVYVLPPTLFSGDVNYAEVEFPIYFNFFVKKGFLNRENRIVLLGDEKELAKVRAVFQESFYGPAPHQIYTDEEIPEDVRKRGYWIDLSAERGTIAAKSPTGEPLPIDDFMNCIPFKEAVDPISGKHVLEATIDVRRKTAPKKAAVDAAAVGDLVSTRVVNNNGLIQFWEEGVKLASVDTNTYPHAHECGEHFEGRAPEGNASSSSSSSEGASSHSHDHAHLPSDMMQMSQHTLEDDAMLRATFQPPTFGVTFLGTSHGFDAGGQTTGFIIWINGEGICVDPPSFTSRYLRENGVASGTVRSLILTHCHSDHDSGMLKKIMDGERVEVFTTRTVHESYCRKMRAVTSLAVEEYYDFTPVPIGRPIKILGAEFEFDYSFHTIPTVRFKVRYAGKSIAYSADTYFDPSFYAKIAQEGVINPARQASLNYFLADADLIIHESGVPPIHTSLAVLNDLPPDIKKKLLVVHCNAIPSEMEREVTIPDPDKPGEFTKKKETVTLRGLHIPPSGLEHTIQLKVREFEEGRSFAIQRFKRFANLFAFRSLRPSTIFQLYLAANETLYKPGEVVMRAGDAADRFCVIHSGRVKVLKGAPPLVRLPSGSVLNHHGGSSHSHPDLDAEQVAVLYAGDAFGESALRKVSGVARNATVVAIHTTVVLSLRDAEFAHIVQSEGPQGAVALERDLEQLARMRPKVKTVLSRTYLFSGLSEEQTMYVACLLSAEKTFRTGEIIVYDKDVSSSIFIIESGNVQLETLDSSGERRPFMRLSAGDIFGEMSVFRNMPRQGFVIATEETVVLELLKDAFEELVRKFPSLRVKLAQVVEGRERQSEGVGSVLYGTNA
jgi:CRP-like cAMP-binding protein